MISIENEFVKKFKYLGRDFQEQALSTVVENM